MSNNRSACALATDDGEHRAPPLPIAPSDCDTEQPRRERARAAAAAFAATLFVQPALVHARIAQLLRDAWRATVVSGVLAVMVVIAIVFVIVIIVLCFCLLFHAAVVERAREPFRELPRTKCAHV